MCTKKSGQAERPEKAGKGKKSGDYRSTRYHIGQKGQKMGPEKKSQKGVDKGAGGVVDYSHGAGDRAPRKEARPGRMNERKVHTMTTNTNTNTNKTNATATIGIEAGAYMGTEWRVMTIGELLSDEDIYLPDIQRDYVWTEQDILRMADTIRRGIASPALVVQAVRRGDTIRLALLDGCQRRETYRRIREAAEKAVADAATAEEEEKAREWLDWVDNYPVMCMIIHAPLDMAGLIFSRYNSGRRLTAAQKGKAALPEQALKAAGAYIAWCRDNLPARAGAVTRDTVGILLAAAAACPLTRLTTSGAIACKLLAGADNIPAPNLEILNGIISAVNEIDVKADKNADWWIAPPRLIPLFRLCLEKKLMPEEIKSIISNIEKYPGGRISIPGKKKGETESVTVSKAFENSSGGPKATIGRYRAFQYILNKGNQKVSGGNEMPSENPEVVAANQEIFENMFEEE